MLINYVKEHTIGGISISKANLDPSLNVTPTSLNWAATETDSKTISVSLNSNGSGYTVSPSDDTDWNISYDESGTITVSPKAANSSTTDAKTLTLTITHEDDETLTKEVVCTQAKASSIDDYESTGNLATFEFTSASYPSNKTDFNATSGSCSSSTFNLNGSGSTWNTPKGYAFTAVTDVTITIKAAKALKQGSTIKLCMDTYYNKASNAPMTGFNLTVSESGNAESTTGLSVTSWTLSNTSQTKTVTYTLQNDVLANSTVKFKLTQTGKAGAGQGYISNVIVDYSSTL